MQYWSFIAESVTTDYRLTSYVASGYPSWLRGFFEHEKSMIDAMSTS